MFLSKAKQIFEELEPDFDTFVDALEWVKITQQTLSDISTATAELTVFSPLPPSRFFKLKPPRKCADLPSYELMLIAIFNLMSFSSTSFIYSGHTPR